jgi:hypothetical protein
MRHRLTNAICLTLCTIAAATACAQPDAGDRDIRAALLELRDDRICRELSPIGTLNQEGMEFVAVEYAARISPLRALAVLSLEHGYIDAIQDISRLTRYEVAPTPPQDPYNETSADYQHLGVFRAHARYLSYDIVRCWADAEYDTALDRVAGMIGLADPLIGSGEALSVSSGSSIRSLAETKLAAIADAAEDAENFPGFSPEALARLRERVGARPSTDPHDLRTMDVVSARRHLRWLRDTFTRENGAAHYQEYLRHYGKTEAQWRDEGAKITSLPDALMIEFLDEARDGKSPTLAAYWDRLTPEQKEDARAAYDEWTGQVGFSPLDARPRLYPDDPDQQLTTEQIASRLDEIGALIDRLDNAGTRQDLRDAMVLLQVRAETDRSQLTRIATQSTGPILYDSSLESHDRMLAALARLEPLTREPDE